MSDVKPAMLPPVEILTEAAVKLASVWLIFREPAAPEECAPIAAKVVLAPVLTIVPVTKPRFRASEICDASVQTPENPFTVWKSTLNVTVSLTTLPSDCVVS